MLPDAVSKLGIVKLCWITESVQKNFPVNVQHCNLVCSDRFLAFQQETLNQIYSNITSRKGRFQFFFGEAFFKNNLKTKTTTTKQQKQRQTNLKTNKKPQQQHQNPQQPNPQSLFYPPQKIQHFLVKWLQGLAN